MFHIGNKAIDVIKLFFEEKVWKIEISFIKNFEIVNTVIEKTLYIIKVVIILIMGLYIIIDTSVVNLIHVDNSVPLVVTLILIIEGIHFEHLLVVVVVVETLVYVLGIFQQNIIVIYLLNFSILELILDNIVT